MTTGNNGQEEHSVEKANIEPHSTNASIPSTQTTEPEVDDFSLLRKQARSSPPTESDDSEDDGETFHDIDSSSNSTNSNDKVIEEVTSGSALPELEPEKLAQEGKIALLEGESSTDPVKTTEGDPLEKEKEAQSVHGPGRTDKYRTEEIQPLDGADGSDTKHDATVIAATSPKIPLTSGTRIFKTEQRSSAPAASEWSHQRHIPVAAQSSNDEEEEEWQPMQAIDEFDIYDDDGRLVAKGHKGTENSDAYAGIGGAGKGYTRVQLDEDAQSATSMDEDTNYLFQSGQKPPETKDTYPEEDEQRDTLTQLEATKDLLTEGQRIAYVGVVRLTIHKMAEALGDLEKTRLTRKELIKSLENMDMWGQKMMVRLYAHMDINPAEQIMIEQLAEHGVQPSHLVAPLMLNAKIRNPLADDASTEPSKPALSQTQDPDTSQSSLKSVQTSLGEDKDGGEVPEMQNSKDMPHTKEIDLDLRWTVLCDLFLVLISDGQYDSRSRRLLERVGSTMDINWIQICRFEKRVMDALEMQEAEAKEDWDENEHMETRRKRALKEKYVFMGLATVGGGLVIGLSAGLLAPLIGAGLAAGFTTIGVTGTAGFLGGVGGAALITSAATAAGGTIAVRAADRRTGSVKTFEYRPLHNNKRLNLILTISGWMTGKVDDVRLPYSTVDPIMGDIYSLLWEPEMLRSMGDTINILATEALTQTVQQILGSTILITLMAALQLPVVLTKLAYLIDNPWSVSLDRANSAGLILADSLIDRHLGQRPITLVGFSLGSRVIFSCLKELSNRGAYGLIQNVYMFGSPVVVSKDEYLRARSVVSGRFLNGYASNDWILGYLFRMTSGGIMQVAGLASVEGIPGIDNVDVSALVNGHMAYRAAMPRLLREVGWEVESDEFTEIEDPDPEDHAQRQRELIHEIDEARKKAEGKPEKKRFGLFKRKAQKKGWETYNANDSNHKRNGSAGQAPGILSDSNVLFDIDAIRRELASEMIEVRELDSTLPPMQITSIANDGQKHVEFLRLPPGLQAEELSRLNLPPRPDEVDVSFTPLRQPYAVRPPRTSSLRPAATSSPQRSPRVSPQRSPQASPDPDGRLSYTYAEPRELVSTLPPLNLTPLASPQLDSFRAAPNVRPEPKAHATDASVPSWGRPSTPSNNSISREIASPVLEHNAWAEGDDGHDRGDVSMTFE